MPRFIDITNQRFNRLVVIRTIGSDDRGHRLWLCQCDCGKEKITETYLLRSGQTQSCGCKQREHTKQMGYKNATHGMSETPEHRIWMHITQRCINPNDQAFPDYGGRGITVCERWSESFENFYADVGPRPSKRLTIERIDNDKGYEPENVKWGTRTEQSRNRRNNIIVNLDDGRQVCLAEACELYGMAAAYHTVLARIQRYGWTAMRALTAPIRGRP